MGNVRTMGCMGAVLAAVPRMRSGASRRQETGADPHALDERGHGLFRLRSAVLLPAGPARARHRAPLRGALAEVHRLLTLELGAVAGFL